MSEIEETTVKGKSLTRKDEYKLSPTREKILEAMVNPEFLGLSITEKCQRIGVSRESWYQALRDEKFMELVGKTSLDLVREKLGEILASSIKTAITCGSRGYQDRRMLLELAGLLRPENEGIIIINVKNE
ncbi:MAG: hypothetical protein HPY74_19885 [Firmicutes bacterium]|nr:hypothetical protein [Bacillota bacterium]